jgi:hypothetical protein
MIAVSIGVYAPVYPAYQSKPGGVTTTPVTLAQHADSGGIERLNANGVKVRAAGASISRQCTGAYAEIRVKASANYANANFTVLVDGVFSATNYIPTGEAAGKTYRTALPNDGMPHTVRYILGDELRADEQGDVLGVEFVSVTDFGGSWVSIPATGTVVIVGADSIPNGYGAASPGYTDGFSLLQKPGQRIIRDAYGSAQAGVQYASSNDDFAAAVMAASWANAPDKVLVLGAGTNDHLLSATDIQTLYLRRIRQAHQLHPTARVSLYTCLPRTDEANLNTEQVRIGQRAAAQLAGVPFVEGADFWQNCFDIAAVPTVAAATKSLPLNGVNQYVELTDSSTSLTNLPGWGFGMLVTIESLYADNGPIALLAKAQLFSGDDLAQLTYVAGQLTSGRILGNWKTAANGPTEGDSLANADLGNEFFLGGSFGSGTPFLVIGSKVYPLKGTFQGPLADSVQPVRWGAAKSFNSGQLEGFLTGGLKNLSLFRRPLTQAEVLYMGGNAGSKEPAALLPNTGALTYKDAACLAYSTMDPALIQVSGGVSTIPNLANAARPFKLIGY